MSMLSFLDTTQNKKKKVRFPFLGFFTIMVMGGIILVQ